ncbi:MAG: hypothetical protein WD690_15090 [Vicinamibacterales bacterium]
MKKVLGYLLGGLAVIFGAATLFFAYFGVQIVYAALTFEGEGSLGTVGLYIAAVVYPVMAIICGSIAWAARRSARRRLARAAS